MVDLSACWNETFLLSLNPGPQLPYLHVDARTAPKACLWRVPCRMDNSTLSNNLRHLREENIQTCYPCSVYARVCIESSTYRIFLTYLTVWCSSAQLWELGTDYPDENFHTRGHCR